MANEKEKLALLLKVVKETNDERIVIEKNKLAMLLNAIQGSDDGANLDIETTKNSV